MTAALGLALCASAHAAEPRVLDDFRDATLWQAKASDSVQARVARDGTAGTCLHYDFGRVSGYAVMRRELPLTLPAHYGMTLKLRGQGAPNALQVKLVDASGDNVWWMNRPDFEPPAQPTTLRIRQRQIEFAWGPTTDRVLRQAAAVELVVASGRGGGAGKLCFEQLTLQTLPAPQAAPAPVITRSAQATTLDLGLPQELNGLLWRWAAPVRGGHAAEVSLSDDGRHWTAVHQLNGSQRDWQALWLPEQEARYVRIRSRSPIAELRHAPPAEWPDRNALLKALAAHAPRSDHPRALHGQQNYWTLVGTDGGGAHAALMSEDGAVEPQRAGPSLEPLVIDATGRRLGWADVQASTSLPEGHLPLPQVRWQHPHFELQVASAAVGDARDAQLLVRYTLRNPTAQRQDLNLALALRPWQVNPPQQFLNTPGGFAPVRQLAWDGRQLAVNGQPWLRTLQAPAQVRAAAFDQGDALAWPQAAALRELTDASGLASAMLQWPMALAAGESRSVVVSLPLAGKTTLPSYADQAQAAFDATANVWRERLNRVAFQLPASAQPLHDSLRSAVAHILMSRDGPALQPGTRSYARSWVRDGAMMVAGLLRMGEVNASRDFVRWYATHLFANGKVPCCVDARGADPVAENDSHGQFIYMVAEVWRHTHDRGELQRLWPQVDAAARYLEQLRQSERSDANRQPGREAFFGTLPASISHEGYSAKPMHSHWDNLWAVAGWRDAALIARTLGHTARADELAAQGAEFKRELAASMALTMAQHQLSVLPASAELGDFDPTSSTMIFSPAGAEALVPRAVLDATWQRYWRESEARRLGQREAKEYTPYEIRSVSALARLGQPAQAQAMLQFFFADQRPAGWNQWAEVVWRDARAPGFIGDMPHAWISSDYLRSALDLLAFERDSDHALVLAAGVLPAWLDERPDGIAVTGLRTAHGALSYSLQRQGDALRLRVAPGLQAPPGGLWLSWQGQLHAVPASGQLALPR